MEYGNSTQAKSWIFDSSSLEACREKAVNLDDDVRLVREGALNRVRKFASGFHESYPNIRSIPVNERSPLSWRDQETLLQFHAQQMHALVGPFPILAELARSDSVLSTAIIFLRRFYLSNSVVDVSPRKIAVAAIFLASKVEEEKLEASALSHATMLLQARVGNSPLCRRELRAVSEDEIFMAEVVLMKGLNHQFRCYHSSSEIHALLPDNSQSLNPVYSRGKEDRSFVGLASRNTKGAIRSLAVAIARRAQIFSDVVFLYSPRHIAIAVIAIASGLVEQQNPAHISSSLVSTFRSRTREDPDILDHSIGNITHMLLDCPEMELRLAHGGVQRKLHLFRAGELKRVLEEVSSQRLRYRMQCRKASPRRKRAFFEMHFTPPRPLKHRKYVKVTPPGPGGYYGEVY